MRIALLAATASLVLAAGCRGPEGSEANAQANISENAQSPAAANAAGAGGPLGSAVSGDDAKRLMDERHEGMEEIGDAMKAAGGALKAASPDLDKVRTEAATIARLAADVSGWFPPGTGPDVGKTRAKAEIWQKPDDFAARTREFEQKAQAFNTAAQGGDLTAIKAAQGELGKTCKGCHDLYQAKKGEH